MRTMQEIVKTNKEPANVRNIKLVDITLDMKVVALDMKVVALVIKQSLKTIRDQNLRMKKISGNSLNRIRQLLVTSGLHKRLCGLFYLVLCIR